MKPCVIYAAKSTVDVHGSLGDQKKAAIEMAAREGLDHRPEWTFEDEDKSAYHGNRGPGLAAALALVERLAIEHDSAVLLVWHSNRLARGSADSPEAPRHLGELMFWARRHNVELRSVSDDSTFQHPMIGFMMGEMAHAESATKSRNVKVGMKRRVEQRGRFSGGRRPYGYRYRDEKENGGGTGPLVIVDAEAAVIRRIFAEYVAGRAQNAIAKDLHREGVPTLTQTEVAAGRHKAGPRASANATWHATTVKGILTKPLFVGLVTFNGQHYPAVDRDGNPTHEPIIDQATWDTACRLRDARQAHGRPRGRRTTGRHLLTEGLLRCTCGAAMSPVTQEEKRPNRRDYGKVYETYQCMKKLQHGVEECSQPPIKREVVDSRVYAYFGRVVFDVEGTRRALRDQADRKLAEHDALRSQAEGELVRVEAALARIEGDYIAGRLDAQDWARFRDRLTAEIEAARAQVERHDQHQQIVVDEIEEFDAEAAIAEELTQMAQLIAGEVEEGSHESVESFRAILKRLFVGFELTSPDKPFGAGVLQGQLWSQATPGGEHPENPMMHLGGDHSLFVYVRPQAIDWHADHSEGFPAVQRAALALRDNFHARFPA